MAKKEDAKTIGRNLSVSFSTKSVEDRKLKAELQRRLDEGRFDSTSNFTKDLLRKGLQATEVGDDDTSSEELDLTLRTIQQQLAELRRSEKDFELLLERVADIDGRTRSLRPAFAQGVAMLLVQMADWDEKEAADWDQADRLERRENPGTEPPGPEGS